MFQKILIANRGEIAVRIARTAKKMGIKTVGIFSEPDKDALHTQTCDEAFFIGPEPLTKSYLSSSKVIEVAMSANAEAIHPGYGFLSENGDFARECYRNKISFIGPSAKVIELMGMKNEAKKFLEKIKIPMIPGYHGPDQSDEKLKSVAKKIGFPVLIKAAAGGGGRGLRVVKTEGDFLDALQAARRESMSSFKNDFVIIEKYLQNARHIEVQIFGDQHSNYVHLHHRDCSLQRKHQKVIEEAPAPKISGKLSGQIGNVAVQIARSVEYEGAGTVEFVVEGDRFYFMEMNTRLQVEHPVTEEITGVDLVEWQFRIAAGEELPLTQEEVKENGHAIEVRVYSEMPEKSFAPSIGEITEFIVPEALSGIRLETGVRQRDVVGTSYDPLIAKLIAHDKSRLSALELMRDALAQFKIFGLHTNISFLLNIIDLQIKSAKLRKPELPRTNYIEENLPELIQFPKDVLMAGLVIVSLYVFFKFNGKSYDLSPKGKNPWLTLKSWRLNLPNKEHLRFFFMDRLEETSIVINDDQSMIVNALSTEVKITNVKFNDKVEVWSGTEMIYDANVLEDRDSLSVHVNGRLCRFEKKSSLGISPELLGGQRSPLPGAVVKILVENGQTVHEGEVLMIIEAMKMEHEIIASSDGVVENINYAVGDQVKEGVEVLSLIKE